MSLVFIFNSRDELMTNENQEKVPNFESIEIDDVEDLIQLSNFYKTNTPKEKFWFMLENVDTVHFIKHPIYTNFHEISHFHDKLDQKWFILLLKFCNFVISLFIFSNCDTFFSLMFAWTIQVQISD